MKQRSRLVFAGLMFVVALTHTAHAEKETTDNKGLVFGSVAMDIPSVMHQRLKPLTNYLSNELKQPVTLRLSSDLTSAAEQLASGNVDIAYLTPVAYLKAHKLGNARPLVKMITKKQSSFKLMIVVRKESPIRSIKDLKGKTFAFGDPAAILQRAVVVNSGIQLEQFGSYRFIGHYDNIARGVANGDFDAGILKDTSAYIWEEKGLRILHASPSLPPYNISVSSRVSNSLFTQIQNALLKLDESNPEHLKVIKALDKNYDGFTKTSDAEYDIVRTLTQPFE